VRRGGYLATGLEQMCIGFVVWPWILSIKCFKHTIVRLRYKSIFIKLFKITDIDAVKYCQDIFRFELPSVRLDRLTKRFLASYSAVENSICRHILIDFSVDTLTVFVLLCLLIIFYCLLPGLW